MSSLKAVFKSDQPYEKEALKTKTCLLTISVGQEVHEGEKFAVTVNLVNNHFGACILLVDDSLQRHSMALTSDKSAEDFYLPSIVAGDQWLERNQETINQLTILSKTLRWDMWLFHPKYQTQRQIIQDLLITDAAYQHIFEATIEEYLKRIMQRLPETQLFYYQRAKQLCLEYLIEECTALCLWPELGCHYEVYPNKRNLAMHETHQRLVIPRYPDLLHALSIKFKNRRQFKPQQFLTATEATIS